MMRGIARFSVVALVIVAGLGLGGCSQSCPQATALHSGIDGAAATAAIRSNFFAVPRPLVDRLETPRNTDVVRMENAPGEHEKDFKTRTGIILTSTAAHFVCQHSSTELVTALSPLLNDSRYAGDAYIILGVVTNNPATGQVLRESGYKLFDAKGNSKIPPKAILEMKQHFDDVLFAPETPEEMSGPTLGDRIHRIQSDLAGLPNPVVKQYMRHGERAGGYSEAVLSSAAGTLLNKYPKYELVSAAYPLIYSPLGSERAVVMVIKALGEDAKFGDELEHYQNNLESEPTRARIDALARDYLLRAGVKVTLRPQLSVPKE